MKKLLFIVIGFMFAVSMAFASPSDQMDFTTMSKADTQMLFGEKQKVAQGKIILLNSEQLQSTQAKGWWSSVIREVQRNLGYINNFFGLEPNDSANVPINERAGATTPAYDVKFHHVMVAYFHKHKR